MRIGCDLVLIDRIEKAVSSSGSQHFLERVFHPSEIEYCNGLKSAANRSASLAARFAAKEAFAKALGTGLLVDGVAPRMVWVERQTSGRPVLCLDEAVQKKVMDAGFKNWDLSLSHQGEYALATVILY